MRGRFITFEGSEGSGKSTQIALAEKYLTDKGYDVMLLREPGGVKISEAVRGLLLDVNNMEMSNECEVLLYMAARAQLVDEVIRPELASGKVILCDRFLDSTLVYQGYGHGMDLDLIKRIGAFATKGIAPDRTILFDIDTEEGLARAGINKDRIEQRSLDYHRRVRAGYLELAKEYSSRFCVVSVDRSKEEIFKEVKGHIERCLSER